MPIDNIRDNLLKYHKEYEKDKEGLNHAEAAVNSIKIPERGGTADHLQRAAGGVHLRGRAHLLGNGITTKYIKDGGVNFLGAEISSPEDLAVMMQAYRNPLFETTRVFYLKDKRIIAVEGLSNRLPSLVEIQFKDSDRPEEHVKQMMAQTGADTFYLLHNHPSGDPTPSFADCILSLRFAKVSGFAGHVVINHKRFALIDTSGSYEIRQIPPESKDQDLMLRPSLNHPLLHQPVKTSDQIALIGKQLVESAGKEEVSYLLYCSGSAIRTIQEISTDVLWDDSLSAWLVEQMKCFGSVNVLCITSDKKLFNHLTPLVKEGYLQDVVFLSEDSSFLSKVEEEHISRRNVDLLVDRMQKESILYYEIAEQNGMRQQAYRSQTGTCRLFVDLDGTLAVFTPVEQIETLYQKGYFQNLKSYGNAVEGLKFYIKDNPETEVYILSSVLADSPYALDEKNAWLDQYLPQVDRAHRIFPLCGKNKADYVPGGVKSTDILVDDYTDNLLSWQAAGGTGIKMMNGINGTKGRWQERRFDAHGLPEAISRQLSNLISRLEMEEIPMTKESRNHYTPKAVNLIATYEELFHVEPSKKVTEYFCDYGMHVIKNDIPISVVQHMYEHGLKSLGLTETDFEKNNRYTYRGNIITDMCQKNGIPIPDYARQEPAQPCINFNDFLERQHSKRSNFDFGTKNLEGENEKSGQEK